MAAVKVTRISGQKKIDIGGNVHIIVGVTLKLGTQNHFYFSKSLIIVKIQPVKCEYASHL